MNAATANESGAAKNPAPPQPSPEFAAAFPGAQPPGSPHQDYFSQLFQAPPVICGLQMKPLSIGRYRLMSRFNVGFAADDERIATAGDLLKAVLICSMTVADFQAFNASPQFRRDVEQFSRVTGFFPPKILEWSLNPKVFFTAPFNWLHRKMFPQQYDTNDGDYLTGEMKKFQQYIEAGAKTPDFWDESPESAASAAHWSQSIEVVLRGNLNWSETEIDEKPLGKALWDFYKFMENSGLVRLMTPDEVADLQKVKPAEQVTRENDYAQKVLAMLHARNGGKNARPEGLEVPHG